MEANIPKHHIKGEICATRPTYREGRIPKAVKVYTVNNESQYILIQNVPSVGAKDELLKLCTSFGALEDHHILDEYPTDDKYTEVYLIKYRNINSARFAKRKLDDSSFFGGALHICYAPEYENVADTRKKLQERRRAVANKIRQHYGHAHTHSHSKNERTDIKDESYLSKDSSPINHTSLGNSLNITQAQFLHSRISLESSHAAVSNTVTTSSLASLERSENSTKVQESPISSSESDIPGAYIPPITFDIPLPLKHNPNNKNQKNVKYEFAMVRSHHATLPSGFTTLNDSPIRLLDKAKEIETSSADNELLSKEGKVSLKLAPSGSKEQSPVVIRDYKISKPTLKFVPRQTVKRKADEDGHTQHDLENAAIKKNAFILGDVQGPSDIPGCRAEKPKLKPGMEDSYRNTISSIRSKITKVISDNVKPH